MKRCAIFWKSTGALVWSGTTYAGLRKYIELYIDAARDRDAFMIVEVSENYSVHVYPLDVFEERNEYAYQES